MAFTMNFTAFHDATLERIILEWAEGTSRVEVVYSHDGNRRRGALLCFGTTHLSCPRSFPWGRSQSINRVSVDDHEGRVTLRVEMQSGDELVVHACGFSIDWGVESLPERRDR